MSGLFAAAGAGLLGWMLARYVLEIPYQSSALLWLAGVGGGLVIVTVAGWLATRRVVKMSPLRVLQTV